MIKLLFHRSRKKCMGLGGLPCAAPLVTPSLRPDLARNTPKIGECNDRTLSLAYREATSNRWC